MHAFKHFVTITRHRHKVMAHCFRCGIPFQGLVHDLSKYSPTEFFPSARFYVGTRSPNEIERQTYGFSKAWLHHKGRNRHHFEYWYDVDPVTKNYHAVRMPVRYAAEMFCDRVAASKIYRGKDYTDADALNYLLNGHHKIYFHPETLELLEGWLRLLAEQGEKAAFAAVRKAVKEDRKARRKTKKEKSDVAV